MALDLHHSLGHYSPGRPLGPRNRIHSCCELDDDRQGPGRAELVARSPVGHAWRRYEASLAIVKWPCLQPLCVQHEWRRWPGPYGPPDATLPAETVPGGAAGPFLDGRFVASAIAAVLAHVPFVQGDPLAGRLEAVAEQPEAREYHSADHESHYATDDVTGKGSSEHENHGAEGAIAARQRK